jgi:hypothetical protein
MKKMKEQHIIVEIQQEEELTIQTKWGQLIMIEEIEFKKQHMIKEKIGKPFLLKFKI